jgi:hypothetical protein
MPVLTELQAYAAMVLFLSRYSKITSSIQVGDILSGMHLVTDDTAFVSFDAGYWEEWQRDVQTVLKAASTEDTWEQFVADELLYKLIAPDGREIRLRVGPDPNYHTEPLSLDDPVQRQLLEQTVNDEANLLSNLNDGVSLYARTLSDGTQIWAHAKDGTIIKGGRSQTPY